MVQHLSDIHGSWSPSPPHDVCARAARERRASGARAARERRAAASRAVHHGVEQQSVQRAPAALGTADSGLLVGPTPMAERAAQSARPVLCATYPMCKQGFDMPELDTLVMATPVTSLEQIVGRILRAHPRKQQPLVVDVVDPFSIFAGEARKRRRYYDEERYEVQQGAL